MADGYLEKRMEEFSSNTKKTTVKHQSLDTLFEKNRSHRGYNKDYVVKRDMLERIVNVNTKVATGKNQQVLRFKLVTKGEEADYVLQNIKLGGMLPELHLPYKGTEPEAFIIVCTSAPESKIIDIDLGISLQSMALKATEMGLNGLIICAFNKANITEHFKLQYEPLAILAVGKGIENIKLKPISVDESRAYYREDGVHYVPKVKLEDIIF
jgi:nitroreductase